MAKIILFGGSFDPIHHGHIYIAKTALKEIKADFVLFIPAKNPRWKNLDTALEDRYQMLELALKQYPYFKLSRCELDSDRKINYTYDTVKNLTYQNDKLYYLIGSDQLDKLHQWYKIDELSKLVSFLVYERDNYPLNIDNLNQYHCILLKGKARDISSTDIRNLRKCDTPKVILDYIASHDLYYIKTLKKYMSLARFNHSLSVASLAYQIALNNHLNVELAYIAGLLHDIARDIDISIQRKYMDEYYPQYKDLKEVIYHQFVAIPFIKELFGIDDPIIFKAIIYHTTGNSNMTSLGKVIYSADKIEPLRNYDSSFMIEACLKDYKEGFKLVLKENKAFYEEKGYDDNNLLTNNAYQYYLK